MQARLPIKLWCATGELYKSCTRSTYLNHFNYLSYAYSPLLAVFYHAIFNCRSFKEDHARHSLGIGCSVWCFRRRNGRGSFLGSQVDWISHLSWYPTRATNRYWMVSKKSISFHHCCFVACHAKVMLTWVDASHYALSSVFRSSCVTNSAELIQIMVSTPLLVALYCLVSKSILV